MKLIMENWRKFVNEQQDPQIEKTLTAAPNEEKCSLRANMYIGCSEFGSERFPRIYFPKGWKHRVEQVRKSRKQSPITSKIFSNITSEIDWKLLQLHRFMMKDYGPTGSDVRQIPQAIIGKISQWTRRIARLDPMWQYAKEKNKKDTIEALKTAGVQIKKEIDDINRSYEKQ